MSERTLRRPRDRLFKSLTGSFQNGLIHILFCVFWWVHFADSLSAASACSAFHRGALRSVGMVRAKRTRSRCLGYRNAERYGGEWHEGDFAGKQVLSERTDGRFSQAGKIK
jgi:hypothetical protein